MSKTPWFERSVEVINKARRRCIENAKLNSDPPEPGGGIVECPECGGQLVYSLRSNGHVHACCETEGCVRWME